MFKDSNVINIKRKASDICMKADMYERYLLQKKSEFEFKNYVQFL